MLAQIAAQFTQYDVESSGGSYMILDRRTSNPVVSGCRNPDKSGGEQGGRWWDE
jgi:hypothetical protein